MLYLYHTYASSNMCTPESLAINLIDTRAHFQEAMVPSSTPLIHAAERNRNGKWRTRRGKRGKESLPDASVWISVGISVATLFYVRDMFWRRGDCAWAYGEKPTPDSHFVSLLPFSRYHQTNRSVCDVVVHCVLGVRASWSRLYSYTRNTRARSRTDSRHIRGICKIPTAHVTTNCCSSDRPTYRCSVKL